MCIRVSKCTTAGLVSDAHVPQLIVKKWEIITSTELKFLENACLNVDNLFVAGKLKRDG